MVISSPSLMLWLARRVREKEEEPATEVNVLGVQAWLMAEYLWRKDY